MIFRIHFEIETDDVIYNDFVVIIGKDEKEIRKLASKEVAKRGGKNPWSEKINAGELGSTIEEMA